MKKKKEEEEDYSQMRTNYLGHLQIQSLDMRPSLLNIELMACRIFFYQSHQQLTYTHNNTPISYYYIISH